MNQEMLQKLGNKIRHVSCNSLRRVYSSQIKEWLGSTNKETTAFIEDLLDENLIAGKIDFICSCDNQNTAYLNKLKREPFRCIECGKEYSMKEVLTIGTLLYEIDKPSVLEYCDDDSDIDINVSKRLNIASFPLQEDKKMEIFIGSSSEAAEFMDKVAVILENSGVIPLPWNASDKDIFVAGTNTIDALFEITKRVDGAIFIFNADDKTWNDKSKFDASSTVRDNVLFEYGLFAGALGGKDKVCFICKGNPKPKIASDLQGITYIDGEKEANARQSIKEWLKRLKKTTE